MEASPFLAWITLYVRHSSPTRSCWSPARAPASNTSTRSFAYKASIRRLVSYKHCFWAENKLREERRTYLQVAAVPHRIVIRVANFRFGHRCLRVNQRYTSDNLPFASRTCTRCTSGAIDAAAHLLLECTADLPHVFSRFGALLCAIPTHADIAAKLNYLFSTHNQASMALFVSHCPCGRPLSARTSDVRVWSITS